MQDSRPDRSRTSQQPPERLRRREDFQQALRRGRRFRHPLLHLVAYRTDRETTRIGFSVSTKVGGAVVRNHIKRRLRMIVRSIPWQPGFDVVLLVQPAAASASFHELCDTIRGVADRLHLLADVAE